VSEVVGVIEGTCPGPCLSSGGKVWARHEPAL